MRFSWILVALASVALVACGDDDGPAEADGGGEPDASSVSDMGSSGSDAATPTDGGSVADGATPSDDGGGASDGGTDPFADAGELPVCGSPPTFAIDVVDPGECATFTPCGGDEVGIWDFAGGCIEVDLSAVSACPGASVTRREGFGRGCVDFDGAFGRRVGQATVEIETRIPPSFCTAGGCAVLQTQLRTNGVTGATCTDATDGGCDCVASATNDLEQASGYTIEGNTIVAGSRRWDYCVEGGAMTYTDVTFGNPEPGTYDLTKR